MATTATRGIDAATMCESFQHAVEHFGDVVALRTPGDAQSFTWREYGERVQAAAARLHELGVRRGDTVGLMLVNRPEFHFWDTGAMHLGATAFSIYNTSARDQVEYLMGDAGNRVVITEEQFADRLEALPGVEHLVLVEDELPSAPDFDLEAHWRAVEPGDVLTLIYTSGTTGPPKGVQLTHRNLMFETRALEVCMPERDGDARLVSYLPMAHIAERGNSHYHAITRAASVTCVEDPAAVVPALPDVRPTVFVGVPRVWEKLKAALEAKLPVPPAQLPPEARAGILQGLGFDQLEVAFVGAAPTPVEVLQFFDDLGIPILEVWGMSETSAVATANTAEHRRIGSVGRALPGVEVRLAEDGEVLVRGELNMLGYRNQPDKTAETIDAEGWLHTGDIGRMDDDGFLQIVDRKKEIIINAAGKNMSPANIEARLKSASPLIGQAVCIGDGRPYNTALLVLEAGYERDDDAIAAAVETANAQLSRVEQIKRWTVLEDEWLPGGDELTPTMKLKRKPIAAKHAAAIEAMYR